MSGTRSFNGRTPDQGAAGSKEGSVATHDPLEPIVDSVVGIVRERAGFVGSVAGLGLGLLFEPKKAPQRRHAALKAANVIPFPANGSSNRLK